MKTQAASLSILCFALAACVGDSPAPVGSSGTPGKPDATSPAPIDAAADVVGITADAGSDANVIADASPDAATGPCNLTANFAAPTLVTELSNTAAQDSARITPSGLELYLTREDPLKFKQIHHYRRATLLSPWGNDTIEGALTVPVGTGAAAQSASLALTFASERIAYLSVFQGGPWKLFSSTRTGMGAQWDIPVALPNIGASNATDEFPWLNAAGDRLYFMSSRGGGFRLFVSRASGASFSTPTPLTLDTAGTANQYGPVLSSSGTTRTLYFAGSVGSNRFIYRSTGSDATFSGTVKDPSLNIGTTNQVTWLSPDSCEVYLTIDNKIYMARRP
jgi:hypothetical protein